MLGPRVLAWDLHRTGRPLRTVENLTSLAYTHQEQGDLVEEVRQICGQPAESSPSTLPRLGWMLTGWPLEVCRSRSQ